MNNDRVLHLRVFLKVFALYLIPFSLTNFLLIFIRGNIDQNDWYTIGILIFCIFSFTVIFYQGYFSTIKSFKTHDILAAEHSIAEAMRKLNWRLVDKYDNVSVYKSPLLKNFGMYHLKINYNDTEIILEGPEIYVDEIIETAKLKSLA